MGIIKGFESIGILRYSPKRLGDQSSPNWWLVIDCDPGLGEYYRHLYWLCQYKCHRLMRPAWKEHVSLIRNERPTKNDFLWGVYNGHSMAFFYDPEVKTNGEYYWLDVYCPGVRLMRKELGLPEEPEFPLHLTIGHENAMKAAEAVKRRFGFKECPHCGAGHRDLVVICRECGYKGGM